MTDEQVEELVVRLVTRFVQAAERIATALEQANAMTFEKAKRSIDTTYASSAADRGEISPGGD